MCRLGYNLKHFFAAVFSHQRSLLAGDDNRKFVVTLQGVSESIMDASDINEEDQEMLMEAPSTRNIVRVKPQAHFSRLMNEGCYNSTVGYICK
jgi:hypothetical protein